MVTDAQRDIIRTAAPLLASGSKALTAYFYELILRDSPPINPLVSQIAISRSLSFRAAGRRCASGASTRSPALAERLACLLGAAARLWREAGQRYRHWAILPEAKRLLTNPGLVEMIARVERRVRPAAPQSRVA
mgnify:CR=1 FL=1